MGAGSPWAKAQVSASMVSPRAMPRARPSAAVSAMMARKVALNGALAMMSPMVQRAAAVTPEMAENNTNLVHSSRSMSSVGGACTPACSKASRSASTRADARLSRSAKTNLQNSPVWAMRPGSAMVVEMKATPLPTLCAGRMPASRSDASTPLRNGTSSVCAPSSGRQSSAAASSPAHFTAKTTASTSPTSRGSSVAIHGTAQCSPSWAARRSPCRGWRPDAPRAQSLRPGGRPR